MEQEKQEKFWDFRLPAVIGALAMLILIIAAVGNNNQSKQWKNEQAGLSGIIDQKNAELEALIQKNGSLEELNQNVDAQKIQIDRMVSHVEKIKEEKSSIESTLIRLQQELQKTTKRLGDVNTTVSASKNTVALLSQEKEALMQEIRVKNTEFQKAQTMYAAELAKVKDEIQANQVRRSQLLEEIQNIETDIATKNKVIDSLVFLQRQKPILEQSIQELNKSNESALKLKAEQAAQLESLQQAITEGSATINAQEERVAALSRELTELTAAVAQKTAQKESLAIMQDHQKKIEYLQSLQKQKESMEAAINSLLEQGQMLEAKNSQLQNAQEQP